MGLDEEAVARLDEDTYRAANYTAIVRNRAQETRMRLLSPLGTTDANNLAEAVGRGSSNPGKWFPVEHYVKAILADAMPDPTAGDVEEAVHGRWVNRVRGALRDSILQEMVEEEQGDGYRVVSTARRRGARRVIVYGITSDAELKKAELLGPALRRANAAELKAGALVGDMAEQCPDEAADLRLFLDEELQRGRRAGLLAAGGSVAGE